MIYLIDDLTLPVPSNCSHRVFIGDITQAIGDMSEFEMLEDWEQVIIEQGPKVLFWQQRNPGVAFQVLTRNKRRYFNSVAKHRFVEVLTN